MPGAGSIAEWGNYASFMGLGIGVFGLFFSILAWRAAKSATAAANEAKQAAYQEHAADDLGRFAQYSQELYDLFQNNRPDRAGLLIQILLFEFSEFRSRWNSIFDTDTRNTFTSIQNDLEVQLRSSQELLLQPDVAIQIKLLDHCSGITQKLRNESGKMMAIRNQEQN